MNRNCYSFFFLCLCWTLSVQAQVVINEFSAANYRQFTDGFGGDEDWVELYNTSTSAVDVSGYYLSDKEDNPTKWTIPEGTTIPGNGYLVFWASSRDEFDGQRYHTNFKITQTRNNEMISLADASGMVIDSHPIDVPNQAGHSWGRFPDGADDWRLFLTPSLEEENTDPRTTYAGKPSIQPAAGAYAGEVEVSILASTPDLTIHYTTDGSTPDENDPIYTTPFTLVETAVIKAIAISDDPAIPPSFVDYHTYLVNETITVPVVSISGDEVEVLLNGDLFLEPLGTLELFTEEGERVADATGDFNKHGNDSWAYPQRGIDYITRDQLGDDFAVKHEIFPEITDRDRFQRLILKAGASDNYPYEPGGAHIRDAFVHTLSQLGEMHMDERTYEPCILFANGKYWGVYEIREKVDDHDYTSYYYGQNRFEIDFIKTWGTTEQEYGSWDDWYALTDYIAANDMTDAANYAYVAERLDIESLVDYMILHSHNVSADWLNWNTGWWRGRDPNGGAQRWRYILWDEDATYGHYINYTFIPDQGPNADLCDFEEIDPFTDFEGHIGIFMALFNNETFQQYYVNRYADLKNTYLSCDYMIPLLDRMVERIAPEMQRHVTRWEGSVNEWENNVQAIRDFMETRCAMLAESVVDCYEDEGITGPYNLTINVEPEGAGRVRANSVEGLGYPWDAIYYGGLEIELEAIANEGHTFQYWEVANNIFAPDQFAEAIQMSLTTNDEITAFFTGFIPCVAAEEVAFDADFTSAAASWIPPGNELAFILRYREVGSVDWETETTQEDAFTLQGLEMCTSYEVEFETVCANSTSDVTTYYFETACVSSTDDLAPIVDVEAYPNPFREQFRVDVVLGESGMLNWQLLSAHGQQVCRGSLGQVSSGQQQLDFNDLGNLSGGVYWLQLEQNGSLQQVRMVKI
ncbi:MAG: CotH kinase family protein [Bacteroidota bacterium]